jgi:Carbohydrate-selective porin, OprB family
MALKQYLTAMLSCMSLAIRAGAQSPLPGEYPTHPFRSPFPSQTAAMSDEFREKYLFGDWFGYRSKLAAHGVKPSLLSIVDPFGSVTGGQRRGASNYDLLCFDLLVETSEFLALTGGQFHVGFAANFGTSLSTHYVGNNFPIQLADVAGVQPRLTYLSYTQSLFNGRLTVRLVPLNRPNKEGQPSAEVGGGRAQTGENIVRSHMPPTQSGTRRSQGLDGVRQAASVRKQERFTALLHHLSLNFSPSQSARAGGLGSPQPTAGSVDSCTPCSASLSR